MHNWIFESIFNSIDPHHIKLVGTAIRTISAKVFGMTKTGGGVWTSALGFKHMRLSNVQQKTMSCNKWNCPSFLVLGQFLSAFIFLGPWPSESAFLIKGHTDPMSGSSEIQNPQGILNFWRDTCLCRCVIYSQLFPIGHHSFCITTFQRQVVMAPPVATCPLNYDNCMCDHILTKGLSIWVIIFGDSGTVMRCHWLTA